MRNLLKRSLFAVACLAVFGLASAQDSAALQADKRGKALLHGNPHLLTSPTRVLVRFREDAGPNERALAVANVHGLRLHRYELVPGLELIDVAEGNARAIQALRNNPHVLYAEPDGVMHADTTPNDPKFSSQWGLNQSSNIDINGPEAWGVTTGNSSFKIAVIDTGVDYNHPDLKANIWTNPGEIAGNGIDDDGNGYVDDVHGYDFINNDSDPMDDVDHGTHCAGILGAVGNNGVGIAGVNWQAKIVALKFLGPDGGVTSDAIRALDYAVKMGIKVSSNSYGGTGTSEQAFVDALSRAAAANHVFIAAAGNDGVDNDVEPHYPSSYSAPNLVSVAALDSTGARAPYSNWGATSVDIAAPGSSILSTTPNNTYQYMSGTSMATPMVAGVAALIYGRNPSWTYSQVIKTLLGTSKKMSSMTGKVVTGAMVNASAALQTGLVSVSFSPSSIRGNGTATGTITLASSAPSGGATVTLSSSDPTAAPAPASVVVPAGAASATFTIAAKNNGSTTKASTVTATYSGKTVSAALNVLPSNYAQFVAQSVPATMVAGQSYTVWFDYKNTGGTTWTAATNYRLISVNPRGNTTWGISRITLPSSVTVAPGATGRFQAMVTAPATSGTYNLQFQPTQENIGEFGSVTTNVPVAVKVAADGATFVSQTVPTTVPAGSDFSASMVLKNVGTNGWSASGLYSLASRQPWDNKNWGTNRVYLPLSVTVAKGSTYTFTQTFTAPSVPGTYYFQWTMLHGGILFGDNTQLVAVKVVQSANDAQFVSQTGIPTTIAHGATFTGTFNLKNLGTAAWSSASVYSLQSVGSNSFGKPSIASPAVAAGASGAFTSTFTAPTTPGTYTLQFRMKSGTTWFGDRTASVSITVT